MLNPSRYKLVEMNYHSLLKVEKQTYIYVYIFTEQVDKHINIIVIVYNRLKLKLGTQNRYCQEDI